MPSFSPPKSLLPVFLVLLLVTCTVLSLAACAVTSGQETAGNYVDDATITAKIKEAFIGDPIVKATQVNVETMRGVVQLSGFVDSPASETRAVYLANHVSGVRSVNDDIIVRTADRHSW